MTKAKFLSQLKRGLSGLREEEKREILYDYEEHFRSAVEKGQSEEDIAGALGNPRLLGRSFRIESLLDDSARGGRTANVLRAVLASLSLGFFNILISVPVFAGLLAVLISLWAAALSLALSGLAVLLAAVLQPLLPASLSLEGLNVALLIFASLGVGALGLLSLIGMWRLSRWFVLITAHYVRFNVRIIKKQEVKQ